MREVNRIGLRNARVKAKGLRSPAVDGIPSGECLGLHRRDEGLNVRVEEVVIELNRCKARLVDRSELLGASSRIFRGRTHRIGIKLESVDVVDVFRAEERIELLIVDAVLGEDCVRQS